MRLLARFLALVLFMSFVVVAPPPLGASTLHTFRDEFNSRDYFNNDGTDVWESDWSESEAPQDARNGNTQVGADGPEDFVLKFMDTVGGEYVERTADLSAFDTAALVFEYRRESILPGFAFTAGVSPNGPAGPFTEVFRIASGNDAGFVATNVIDISTLLSATTTVRFTHEAGALSGGQEFYLDNIEIAAKTANSPPDAVDDSDTTLVNTPVTIDVLGNDSDPDTDPLTVSGFTAASNGMVGGSGSDVTYTPDPGWTGLDTFTYTINDGDGGFDTALVTVAVKEVVYRDEFNAQAYDGDDGTAPWSSDWFESGGSSPLIGERRVDADGAEMYVLMFADSTPGEYVERTADLSLLTVPELTFDYRQELMTPSVGFEVQVSEDGSTWSTEWSMWGSGSDAAYVPVAVDLSGYGANPTIVRFAHVAGTPAGFIFHIDNVQIAEETNMPPVADATNGEPYVINEGGPVTLNGSASSDPELGPLTYAWDLDNDTIYGEPGEPVGATSATLVPWATLQNFGIDDNGSYPIGLRVTDDALQSDTTTTTLTVNNTAPTITVAGAASVEANATYTLNLSAVDPGNETISGWTINWGDGTVVPVGDVSSTTHVYTDPGFTRNITVSVTDEDGTYAPGDLLVTSLGTDSLFRFDATSGTLVGEFADLNGLDNPIDVEIGPDGLVYVSGFVSNDITRYDAATGAFVDQFVPPGSGGLVEPGRMVFGPDGHLYVSSYGTDEVLRYDGSSGAFKDAFVTAGSGTLDQPDGIAFGPDGNLYVVCGAGGQILRYNGSTGAFIDTFALIGGTGYADLAFGPDSKLYVSNVSLNKVQRFDGGSGAKIDDFVGVGSGGIGGAAGLALGPDGHLYVVGFTSHNVLRYHAANGAFIDEYASAAAGLNQPVNLVFTPAEQVLVTAGNNDPVAVDDTDSTSEDVAVTVDVLDNDSDPDTDPLSVDSVIQGVNGSVVNNGTDITYTPSLNWNGTDTFTYTVTDSKGGFATAQVTVMVSAQPDPPDAVDDTATTEADTDTYVWVLANDSDPDLDSLTVDSATDGAHGTVTNHGFKVAYTPEPGWTGIDTFTYTVTDGNGGFDTATVTVTVTPGNQPPAAADDSDTTPEDTAVTVDVLGNDSDPEGDGLSVDSVTQGANGSVTNNGTDVTYTPNLNWNGSDTFTYKVADGNGGFATARVTITVAPVPDDPVAVDDSETVVADTSMVIPVLANDSDPDGDSLTITGVIDGTHGTVTNNGSDVTYVPEPGWSGIDTFTYSVTDGNGGFDSALVTVEVTAGPNRPPVAADDKTVTNEDVPVTVAVLGNDSDPDGNTLTVASVNQGGHGSVTTSAGDVTYTPDKNWSGIDSFSYTVSDGLGGSATAAVIVTVKPVNDAPVAGNDYVSVRGSAAVTIAVLANDSDPDGDRLIVTGVSQAGNGVTTSEGNRVTYSPSPGWSGTDSFTYTISDGHGGIARAEVVVTVGRLNTAPVITVTGETAVPQGGQLVLEIVVEDADGDSVSIGVDGLPEWAEVVELGDGAVTITGLPGSDAEPFSEVTVSASDGTVTTELVVTIEVRAVNQPPVIGSVTFSGIGADGSFSFAITASDPDGDPLFMSADGLPSWATFSDHSDGTATIRSAGLPGNAIGSLAVVISVTDGEHTVTRDLARSFADLRPARPPEETHQRFAVLSGDTLVATSLKPKVASPTPPSAHLTPREGLMVAFGSAVETLGGQMVPAIVLGVVMAWMLMIGVGRSKDEEEEAA